MRILKLGPGKGGFTDKVGETDDSSVLQIKWGKQRICPGNDWFYGCMIGDEKSPSVGGLEGIFSCGL